MARREAIEDIMKCIDDELIICNIGFPSRELYDIEDREENFEYGFSCYSICK